ncbi:MAG: winged helix-turn-helix domain-containing protein [Candidatus Levyibacteriota bacterium]
MYDDHFVAQFPQDTREAELRQVIRYIRDGSSCQLIGIPGVSRATVLGLLVYNKHVRQKHLGAFQHESHFISVDFSEIRNRPLFDVMKYLFLNLTESLRERGMAEENKAVGDIFREHLKFQDELVLFQGFKEAVDYLALEKKLTIVFLFNRFEEYVPNVSKEFFTNLRILRSRAKYRFSIVFSVNRPLEDMLTPEIMSEYYEFIAGKSVYLTLSDTSSNTFWHTHIEKITGEKVPKNIFETVLQLTGGHGKLTKLSLEAFLAQDNKQNVTESFLLTQKTILGALREIWQSLLPAEQADLKESSFTDVEITSYLEGVGLIQQNKIQIPLLTTYIHSESPQIINVAKKIVYNQNTDTIQKGDIILSDQLTSAEFRLLRYLLQHEERITEREDLIDVVWEGNKSTAGITDQAVDQLIFRVRHKIEEDANHPTHLITVKGRGFKFSS